MATSQTRPAGTRVLVGRGAGMLAIALAVNFLLGWIALSQNLVATTEFFRYPAIAVWTLLGTGGATAAYGALSRRSVAPDRTFRRVAAVVLVLSFAPDIGLALTASSVSTSEAIGLMALHVPPAIVAVLAPPETTLSL